MYYFDNWAIIWHGNIPAFLKICKKFAAFTHKVVFVIVSVVKLLRNNNINNFVSKCYKEHEWPFSPMLFLSLNGSNLCKYELVMESFFLKIVNLCNNAMSNSIRLKTEDVNHLWIFVNFSGNHYSKIHYYMVCHYGNIHV